MKIAAIDPGTRAVGYCVLDWSRRRLRLVVLGTFRPRSRSLPGRLAEIDSAIRALFRKFRPAHVAVERAFVGRNALAALRLGESRGLALAAAALSGAEVFEYTAPEAKRAVSFNGASSKSAVQEAVRRMLGLSRLPEPDAADAAALSLCHASRHLAL